MKREHLLRIGCLLAALALAACSDPAALWLKGGATAAERDRDYASCRAEARAATGAGIDQDMLASQAGRSPLAGPPAESPGGVTEADARRTDAALESCMGASGYHRAPD